MRWHRRAGSDRDSNPEATRRARMTEDFGSRDEKGGASPFTDMIEATRLTSLGRLDEATALIQRSFAGPRAAPPAGAPTRREESAGENRAEATRESGASHDRLLRPSRGRVGLLYVRCRPLHRPARLRRRE